MARRATSLGPKPSLFFGFCFLFVVFVFFVFVFFGGFKGQVRWPKGPPHLALNPPFLFFFFGLFFLCFLIGKPCLPPKKGKICLFICASLCFSLALFGPPPFFPFLFLCLSLSLSLFLSLSLSCSFLFLLPSYFSFMFLVLALSFCFFVSRCYFVFCFFFFSACCLALF